MKFEIAPKSTEIELNWYDAKLYCFSLNIDSKTGWRLPTKEELKEIYRSDNDFEKTRYWSSTEANNDYYVWNHCFANGAQHRFTTDLNCYVRAIREL